MSGLEAIIQNYRPNVPAGAWEVDLADAADLLEEEGAPPLRWFWLLGDVPYIIHSGRRFSIAANWDEIRETLQRWVSKHPTVVNYAHLDNGKGLGLVRRIEEATAEQVAAVGGRLPTPRALFAGVEFNEVGERAYQANEYYYTSPNLRFGGEDELGNQWPVMMRELTFTARPHQKVTQPEAGSYRDLVLSEDATNEEDQKMPGTTIKDDKRAAAGKGPSQGEPGEGPGDASDTAVSRAEFDALKSRIERLIEQMEQSGDGAAADPDMALSDGGAHDARFIKLEKEHAKMRDELAKRDAGDAVDLLLSDRDSDIDRSELISDYLQNPKLVERMITRLPVKAPGSKTTRRALAGSGVAEDLVLSDLDGEEYDKEADRLITVRMREHGEDYGTAYRQVTGR